MNLQEAVARSTEVVNVAYECARQICAQEGLVFESPEQERAVVSNLANLALAESAEFREAVGSIVWHKLNGGQP